jgi:hypothetical protein
MNPDLFIFIQQEIKVELQLDGSLVSKKEINQDF